MNVFGMVMWVLRALDRFHHFHAHETYVGSERKEGILTGKVLWECRCGQVEAKR